MGNRIEKRYFPDAGNRNHYISDFYVRDAQGNIMATYKYEFDFANSVNRLDLEEFHMYGSSRIGTIQLGFNLYDNDPNPNWTEPITNLRAGHKRYELTNHLGNVMAVVNDRTQGVHADADGIIDYYEATVLKANEYYPFGSYMPSREFTFEDYRFGFNGQEKTDEIAGLGNHNTAMYWEYDTRLGRRWNVDPVPQIFLSDYSVLSLNPIHNIDPNGNSYSPIFDAETGDYLGSDSEGFAKGDVLYMDRTKFLELSDGNKKTIEHKVAVENSQYTNKTLPDNSMGIELFKKSSNIISQAIYKAYEKTKPLLEGNSIYVERLSKGDIARYDEASISPSGEWMHRVIFNFNNRTDYLSTPMNIFSVFLHEFEGHGVRSINNSQHGEIYLMQFKHPSYKLLTETMQNHILQKLDYYGIKH